MPSLEVEEQITHNLDDLPEKQQQTLSGPIVGIIYPPPEVRSILFTNYKVFAKL